MSLDPLLVVTVPEFPLPADDAPPDDGPSLDPPLVTPRLVATDPDVLAPKEDGPTPDDVLAAATDEPGEDDDTNERDDIPVEDARELPLLLETPPDPEEDEEDVPFSGGGAWSLVVAGGHAQRRTTGPRSASRRVSIPATLRHWTTQSKAGPQCATFNAQEAHWPEPFPPTRARCNIVRPIAIQGLVELQGH